MLILYLREKSNAHTLSCVPLIQVLDMLPLDVLTVALCKYYNTDTIIEKKLALLTQS